MNLLVKHIMMSEFDVIVTLHPKNVAEFLVKFFGTLALTAASEKSIGAR